MDDEDLYVEIIDTEAELCYQAAKRVLEYGIRFEYAHFWEDICFKNGPLVRPQVFDELVGKHYHRITDLAVSYTHLDVDKRQVCFSEIHKRFDENELHDWCHVISNAMVVTAALLYGEGDYGKTCLLYTSRCV